ncbi:MAG: class I SAM-dependent methyltransferase [Cytophagaceae bacterium]
MADYKEFGWTFENEPGAHKYLYPDILSLLTKEKNKTILDVGCGNGIMVRRLLNEGYNTYGIDASSQGIEIAKKFVSDRFFVNDVESQKLPVEIEDINFDTIISTEVIEHLYDPIGYIMFCKSILEKNKKGEIIISTPYHGYFKNLAITFTGSFDKHVNPLRTGGHIKFWSKDTLSKLLINAGFKVVKFKGSGRFKFFWKSMVIKATL